MENFGREDSSHKKQHRCPGRIYMRFALGINADDLANNFFTEQKYNIDYRMQNVDETMFTDAVKAANGNLTGSDMNGVAEILGTNWYTTSVYFLANNSIRHVFTKATDAFRPEDYPKNQKNFYYYIQSGNIAAAELDSLQKFNIGNVEFYYSVLDYAKVLAESTKNTAEQRDLAKSLYWYNQAANKFFG